MEFVQESVKHVLIKSDFYWKKKEYEKVSYKERGNRPHLCHNNHRKYCRGSYDLSLELGLKQEVTE